MAQRDYYADLELPATADISDIKKQFRKLALKYHPDRNPGREQEVNAQFQIIQSAHEVLSDPDQKAKYDASRTRSRYGGASGVKGNPWANVATNFPPPPRRNNNAQARPPPPPPPSGADRWRGRFAPGVPPTAKQAHGGTSEAKKNAAQAFENMRKSGHGRESRPQPPPPPPRTESARQKAQASFGTSSRKGGFQPRSGMMGDEPPVASNNYTSRRPESERYTYAAPEPKQPEPRKPEPPKQPPRPAAEPVPDPLRQFREQSNTPFDSRQSTPYSVHTGEKTNPFDGIPLGRAKSTRESTRRDSTSSEEEEISYRQRSASAPKAGNAESSQTPRRKPVPTQEPKTAERPEDRPKAPLKKNRSFPASNKSHPDLSNAAPPTNATTEPPHDAPGANSSKPQNNGAGGPSMYAKLSFQKSPCISSPALSRDTIHNNEHRCGGPADQNNDMQPRQHSNNCSTQTSTPSGGQTTFLTLTTFEKQQHTLLSQLIDNLGVGKALKKKSSTSHQSKHRLNSNNADKSIFNSFNFSGNEGGFSQMPPNHQFARSSTDDINTSFADDEDSTTWHFSAGGAEDAQPMSRSQSGSRTGRRSPLKRPPSQQPETPSAPSESGKSEGAFNAEGWNDKFGPQTFVPQPTQSQTTSPTRPHRAGSRKPKPTKTAGGSAAVIDDNSEEEEVFEWRGRKAQGEPVAAESPQAMDIDSPPASSPAGVATDIPAPATPSPQSNAARNIPVEPTRPEWRPGSGEAVNGEPKPPPVPEKIKEFDPNAVGSEDSEEFRASFADLKNVAPFAQQESGLKSFADLKDTLPFDSKASADVPIKLPKAPALAFPQIPVAPQPPQAVFMHGMHPNMQSWEKYVKEFETYLRKWDTLNSQVVDHFATRKTMIAKSRETKGYGFLEARDNTDIQEYFNWVQQDMDVRKRWSEACEEHSLRLREFMAFRQKMK